ncbi:hypothetical protein ACS0TY_019052 [Phlomoides rotata]
MFLNAYCHFQSHSVTSLEGQQNLKHFQRERGGEEESRRRASEFLEAALDQELGKDAAVREIKEEGQKSLAVGIIGAPNTGKSSLSNFMAVQRPWDEDPFAAMTEEVMKNVSLEIVREKLLDHVHQVIFSFHGSIIIY